MNWHIGCSGFHYQDWKEAFYPKGVPPKRWLEYYFGHFNTLEVNNTFYRFPKLSLFEGWYAKTPETFRFTVKAPASITHYRRFKEVQMLTAEFYQVITLGLKEKLGCVLFQLPPSYAYSDENLERIIRALDPHFNNVVEFRHESWWNQEVYDRLKAAGITFCSISHPSLPETIIVNHSTFYYRFHGVPTIYASAYGSEKLAWFAEAFKKITASEGYLYFNNTMKAVGAVEAEEMKRLMSL